MIYILYGAVIVILVNILIFAAEVFIAILGTALALWILVIIVEALLTKPPDKPTKEA